MTISYNWLREYLPENLQNIEPEKLSNILTSVGLEVESMEKYEEFKGGLEGLIVGEVKECIKHPEADKLSLTKVSTGNEILQIVCGAPNVAAGQKVVVATVGTTIYPVSGESVTMKKAKIRGQESMGMICAEDEIGIGTSHAGIIILPDDIAAGSNAADYFKPYSDWIFEIGLTPNRTDAMSHSGVAKDVCAYLAHHEKNISAVKSPFKNNFKKDDDSLSIKVIVENTLACPRYSGVSITGITVMESPLWLQQKLKSIGVKPINNIVDITNFILHESGQPLHAYDADDIKENTIIVKNLHEGTAFVTLDEKERKLSATDLMICNGNSEPMCIAGVYGGLNSGIKNSTVNIFLESAWFEPAAIRRTSVRHDLRTEAAVHFEKGVDIGNTVNVLKRAAMLIKEIAGGSVSSAIIDVYPEPKLKTEVVLKNHYLKKLSGKNYHPDAVKKILGSLGFEIIREGLDDITIAAPLSNPDIKLPADIIEEIMRIDGLDNIPVPSAVYISPATESFAFENNLKEKTAQYLAASGFSEIFTNSLTNSKYYNEEKLSETVKILNSLSYELNVLKPDMIQTVLESAAYNINRKNNDLRFFEFGKTYSVSDSKFEETGHLSICITGNKSSQAWNEKAKKADLFFMKGICEKIFLSAGITDIIFNASEKNDGSVEIKAGKKYLGEIYEVPQKMSESFSIKQPVYFADIIWEAFSEIAKMKTIIYEPVSKFPSVNRDLSIVVDKNISFEKVRKATKAANISRLAATRLFDVFESDKLGEGKKSFAVSFTFFDKEKTLTDKEIDAMVNRLIQFYEKDLDAQIRKS